MEAGMVCSHWQLPHTLVPSGSGCSRASCAALVEGSSVGRRARGRPALVMSEGWWLICSLQQGLCCHCSLFCQ